MAIFPATRATRLGKATPGYALAVCDRLSLDLLDSRVWLCQRIVGSVRAPGDGTLTGRYRGDVLTNPIALPAVTLTDQSGDSFDLRSNTAGKLVLLFIG
jgi:hypothetical protein